MLDIAVIIGSTRPQRKGAAVAQWVHQLASTRNDARYDLVDIADQGLPLLDEAIAPSQGHYSQPHTVAWAGRIARYDGFVFVTPEYNHGPPAALKNALDFLYKEWNDKVAGFVGYGGTGATRAVEQLRLVMAELQMATVRSEVMLSLRTDFENFETFKPADHQPRAVHGMLDQLLAWGKALRSVRGK